MARRAPTAPAQSPRRRSPASRWRDGALVWLSAWAVGAALLLVGGVREVWRAARGQAAAQLSDAMVAGASEAAAAGGAVRWRQALIVWVLAWISGGVLLALAGGAVVAFGLFPTAATTPHLPETEWAIHRTFEDSVRRQATPLTLTPTPAQVTAGFVQYDRHCAICHGGPGAPRADFATGMNPAPPYIVDAARTWTPGQLYWILDHGVKMTAMPSWREVMTRDQMVDTVAFLEALPYLSPTDYARLRAATRSSPSSGSGGPAAAPLAPAAPPPIPAA